MIMFGECLQDVFLCVLAEQVNANPDVLKRLLADLEDIYWRYEWDPGSSDEPFDAGIRFEVVPLGAGWFAMRHGKTVDGLWLSDEMDQLDLREQVVRVLSGEQTRLKLPRKFPKLTIDSIEVAKRYSETEVQLRSGCETRDHIVCPASIVQVSDSDLIELIERIDELSAKLWPYVVYRKERPHAVRFSRWPTDGKGESIRLGFSYLEPYRAQIEAMLAGTRPMIPFD